MPMMYVKRWEMETQVVTKWAPNSPDSGLHWRHLQLSIKHGQQSLKLKPNYKLPNWLQFLQISQLAKFYIARAPTSIFLFQFVAPSSTFLSQPCFATLPISSSSDKSLSTPCTWGSHFSLISILISFRNPTLQTFKRFASNWDRNQTTSSGECFLDLLRLTGTGKTEPVGPHTTQGSLKIAWNDSRTHSHLLPYSSICQRR